MKARVEHHWSGSQGTHYIEVYDVDDSVILEMDFPERVGCPGGTHDPHDDILDVLQAIEVIYEQREGPLQVFLTK